MKKLLLAICGLVVTCACGGGGGGGGGCDTAAPPAHLRFHFSFDPDQYRSGTNREIHRDRGKRLEHQGSDLERFRGRGLRARPVGPLPIQRRARQPTMPRPRFQPTSSITVTATSVADPTKTGSAVVMVSPPPSITTTTLTNATPNANYSATLQATGGVGTLTWSLAGGALPTGLSLSSSGAITGDPTVSGTSTFTVQVTDSSAAPGGPASAQAQLSLTVVTR